MGIQTSIQNWRCIGIGVLNPLILIIKKCTNIEDWENFSQIIDKE